MKILRSVFFSCLLAAATAHAQYAKLPQIPSGEFLVTAFGAVGDGKTLNTAAIQKALNEVREKGGTVVVPKGVFLCGPLQMYGKTDLQLQEGAVLRLRNDIDSFPAEKERYLNFINITKASDVKISGKGTIDGQGELWWKKVETKELTFRRPQMVYIDGTDRIEISGVTFLNPPNTHLSLKNTSEVYIHDVRIQAPASSHNTDGINISAKNCTIERCTINTGDDNIAVNFGNRPDPSGAPECKNILIQNCSFGYGHGLSIGSFTSGGLKNLSVSNCRFDGTTSAIRMKTARGRGSVVEDVHFSNIDIRNSKWPVFISEYYPKEPAAPEQDPAPPVGEKTPAFKNITLTKVTATNAQEAVKIWGLPESPIQNLRFEQVTIEAKNGGQISNAQGVEFVNSKIRVDKGQELQTYQAEVKGL